jgi:2-keto-4-pentenoate hydratase
MVAADITEGVARALWSAELARNPVDPVSGSHPHFSTADAYAVQQGISDIRLKLGHRPCGRKIGLTSRAVQEMVGLDEPDHGQLFEEMRIEDGGVLSLDGLIQAKIEPELAFVFARPLSGANLTAADVLAATDHVCAAFEIVDCRIRDWRVRGIDAVSDNGSAARFVLSRSRVAPAGLDLGAIALTFARNGEVVTRTSLKEVMGNPANAVCWLATKLSSQGRRIEAGDVVLTGAPCKPLDLARGDVFEARFDGLGGVVVRCA